MTVDGWRLAFTEDADYWGAQVYPIEMLAKIPLSYETAAGS